MAEYKYVDWPGLKYYHGKVVDLIDSKVTPCIKFGGEVLFESLPSPDTPNLNVVYKIIDSFSVASGNKWFHNSMWNKNYQEGVIIQTVQDLDGVVVYKLIQEPPEKPKEVDLTGYATIELVNSLLETKSDSIPFTTDLVVNNPVGGFELNDSVKDMTIKEILVKLLGLNEYRSIIDTILEEQLPYFSGTQLGEVEISSMFRELSIEDKAVDEDGDSLTGFYRNEDNTEAGYQIVLPAQNESNPGYILLPENIKVRCFYQWNQLDQTWSIQDKNIFKIVGSQIKTVNNNQYTYNKYLWDEDYYGSVIFEDSNWRFEIEV